MLGDDIAVSEDMFEREAELRGAVVWYGVACDHCVDTDCLYSDHCSTAPPELA